MRSREHGTAVWDFVARNWDELTARFPDNSISRMLSGITSITDEPIVAAIEAFLAEHPVPQAAKTVEQHREQMRINTALKAREGARLSAAL